MTGGDSLRAGVIGVGSMGRNHARIYRELANVDLYGVADADERAAREVAAEYDTAALHVPDLLAAVDVVSVAVPTAVHADVVADCLDAGEVRLDREVLAVAGSGRLEVEGVDRWQF